MFSLAYVVLPFSGVAPAEAFRASLARFQVGSRGDVPEAWLSFDDQTEELRHSLQTRFIFTDAQPGGLRIEGDGNAAWFVDGRAVQDDMRRRGVTRWEARFADLMDLDAFAARFAHRVEHDPATGRYGRWLNPLGRWDWWDLGGRFDGRILGERDRADRRHASRIGSGEHRGRVILANVEDVFRTALDQPAPDTVDVRTDRNIELAATLLADAKAGLSQACPGSIVLPPGSVPDRLRWLATWPDRGPAEAFTALGLDPDADWRSVAQAAYERFEDHWVAGIAYHH